MTDAMMKRATAALDQLKASIEELASRHYLVSCVFEQLPETVDYIELRDPETNEVAEKMPGQRLPGDITMLVRFRATSQDPSVPQRDAEGG